MTPEELVAIACPKVRDLGWAFYFTPETVEVGKQLGIDGFRFYFLGRGGVLGDVEPLVVSSAFGYFNPSLVAHMWNTGKEKVAPRVAGQAFVGCAADFGRSHLGDLDGLDSFCAALDAVNDAADPVGLALYAAAKSERFADDIPARTMQLLALLREFRGSAHLIALRASGLDERKAHFLRRPNDMGMFGWKPEDAPSVTDADAVLLDAAEALTDALVLPAYSVLDQAGRQALVDGLAAVENRLAAVAAANPPASRK